MGASRGGTSGRRRALRGPKAAAVTATATGLAAPEEMTTAGFFLEERGGGGPRAQQRNYHPKSQQNQNLGVNVFEILPPIPFRCCFPDQQEDPDQCIHSQIDFGKKLFHNYSFHYY